MTTKPERPDYSVGDLVQIKPDHPWGGCVLVVSEIRTWGCIAYVSIPHNDGTPAGLAYQRLADEEFVIVGQAKWLWSEGALQQ